MKITAKRLAELLGVSPATISMVFNGKPGISEQTVRRVLEGAAQYGYVHRAAGASRQGRNITLLICKRSGFPFLENEFFAPVVQRLEAAAVAAGYTLNLSYFYEQQDAVEQLNVLRRSAPAGVILLATGLSERRAEIFSTLGLPLVLLDNHLDSLPVDSVSINNVQSAFAAVRYLVELGHRRIGYVGFENRLNNFNDRLRGASLALRLCAGRTLEEALIWRDLSLDGTTGLLARHLRACRELPTAFFAENDFAAMALLAALRAHGCRVPQDVSVIGFDDVPTAELTDPPLTTMRVNRAALADAAMTLLRRQIEDGRAGGWCVSLNAELAPRQSVAEAARGSCSKR